MTESLRYSSSRMSEVTLKKIKQGKLNVNKLNHIHEESENYPGKLMDSLEIEIHPETSSSFAFSYSDNFDFDDFERNRGILHDSQDDDTYLIDIEEEFEASSAKKHELTDSSETNKKHYQHFIAGGLGGAISRTITAPLDRLKILYQVNYTGKGLRPPSIFVGLTQVYMQDGFKGLFRGNLMSLLKSTPDTAIKLYIFEKCKSFFKSIYGEKLSSSHLFIAGAVAGVTANFTIFPLDVIKTRLSAAPSGTYNGIFDTAGKLYKEGGVGIFYKGVEASICCTIPNSGLNLLFYELLKRAFSGSYSSNNAANLSTPVLMFIGGLSSMFSSTLLYPFQTIQSRIIMQGLPKSSDYKNLRYNTPYYYNGHKLVFQKRQSMIQIIKSTFVNEGPRGFFKGYGPGITKIILGNAIGFGLYERIKSLVGNI
jgi:solute carrier family 25 (mitochondrial phosphate transporter), member 23/24/25/41